MAKQIAKSRQDVMGVNYVEDANERIVLDSN